MKPYVISLASQKGGVGKTTNAINLAHGLILRGYKVLLGDADRQGSIRDWNEGNEASLIPVVGLDRETLVKDLEAVWSGYSIVIIDTPPRISKITASAIKVSDLVIIPVQPSPHDVLATSETVELIKQRQAITDEGPEATFLISRVIKNSLISREVIEPLKDYAFPILENFTSQHVWYAQSQQYGKTVYSDPKSVASREFDLIVDEIVSKYISRFI